MDELSPFSGENKTASKSEFEPFHPTCNDDNDLELTTISMKGNVSDKPCIFIRGNIAMSCIGEFLAIRIEKTQNGFGDHSNCTTIRKRGDHNTPC
jgi:hypothetical protein